MEKKWIDKHRDMLAQVLRPYKFTDKDKNKNFNIMECCICLEKYKEGEKSLLRTPCNHIYHGTCLTDSLDAKLKILFRS